MDLFHICRMRFGFLYILALVSSNSVMRLSLLLLSVFASLVSYPQKPDSLLKPELIYPLAHTMDVAHASFSKDTRYLITASVDGTAKVWECETGKLIRTLNGHFLNVNYADFSPDGKLAATASNDSTVIIWDLLRGTIKKTLKLNSQAAISKFSNTGEWIVCTAVNKISSVSSKASPGVYLYNLRLDDLQRIDSLRAMSIQFSDDDNWLSVRSGTTIKYLNLKSIKAKPQATNQNYSFDRQGLWDRGAEIAHWSPSLFLDNERVIVTSRDSLIRLFNLRTGKVEKRFGPAGSAHATISSDRLRALVGYMTKSFNIKHLLIDLKTFAVIDSIKCDEFQMARFYPSTQRAFCQGRGFVTISNNSNYVFRSNASEQPENSGRLKKLSENLDNEKEIPLGIDQRQFFGSRGFLTKLSKSKKYFLKTTYGVVNGVSYSYEHVELYDSSARKKLFYFRAHYDNIALIDFSPNEEWFITAEEYNEIIKFWDIKTGKLAYQFNGGAGTDAVDSIKFDPSLKAFTSFHHSGKQTYWHVDNSKPVLVKYKIGEEDFIVVHPSGLFDASPGAMDKLYFSQGFDIIDFSQLKDRYYEPGLWKKVMTGEELRNVVGFKSIDLPPQINVGQIGKDGFLDIELINRGGGIGEVNIFINGKEAITDARDKSVKTNSQKAKLKVYIANHKSIIKGQENLVAVKAWNKDHWVVSRSQVVSYESKTIEQYRPSVHILSCGVSDYTGTEIDLKYAAKDAEDVSKAIQLGAKQLFGAGKTYAYTLTTDRSKESYPTRSNILKTLNTIAEKAHPLDVFVMYVSGHGINYGGQDGDWYFLTQEAYTGNGTAYNDPAIRNQTTISSNELVELFRKVPALKQVLIIDACVSGRVVENLRSQRDISSNTLRALDRMRDRTGMHIITGCAADAVSYEASKYGQGVLTYSLLEGIRGAALREEKFVDVNKLFQYANERVPALAEGIGGIQTPQIFSPQGSQSFDIGLLTEIEKKEIPISQERPVYIRSNFQDENEFEDILGLGKWIDDALNEASARGVDAKLIFVDVKDYPDGCKLIGRYQKEGERIILKLRKKCGEEITNYEFKAESLDQLKQEVLKVL